MSDQPVSPDLPGDADGGGDAPSGVSARARVVGDRVLAHYAALQERSGPVRVVAELLERTLSEGGTAVAGLLAYRLFVIVFPVGVIVVALAGFDHIGAAGAAGDMGLGQTVASSIAQAGRDAERSRVPLLVAGVAGLAFATWGLLGAPQYAAAVAWRIPTRRFPRRGRAVLRLASSVVVFAGVLYLSILVRRAGLLAGLAATGANLVACTVAYFGLSWILPHRCREWFWLVPGALVGTVGVAGLQVVATYYLPGEISDSSQTYGALGVGLATLTYLYLLGMLTWLVLLVDVVVWEHYRTSPPGILRRIAEVLPIPETTFASGHVGEHDVVETVGGPQRPVA